jgi:hypothetical protein
MKSQTKVGNEDGYIKLNNGASVTMIAQYTMQISCNIAVSMECLAGYLFQMLDPIHKAEGGAKRKHDSYPALMWSINWLTN